MPHSNAAKELCTVMVCGATLVAGDHWQRYGTFLNLISSKLTVFNSSFLRRSKRNAAHCSSWSWQASTGTKPGTKTWYFAGWLAITERGKDQSGNNDEGPVVCGLCTGQGWFEGGWKLYIYTTRYNMDDIYSFSLYTGPIRVATTRCGALAAVTIVLKSLFSVRVTTPHTRTQRSDPSVDVYVMPEEICDQASAKFAWKKSPTEERPCYCKLPHLSNDSNVNGRTHGRKV